MKCTSMYVALSNVPCKMIFKLEIIITINGLAIYYIDAIIFRNNLILIQSIVNEITMSEHWYIVV